MRTRGLHIYLQKDYSLTQFPETVDSLHIHSWLCKKGTDISHSGVKWNRLWGNTASSEKQGRKQKYWSAYDKSLLRGVEWLKASSGTLHQKVTGCGHSSTLCLDKHIHKLEYVLLKLILD